MYRTLLVEHRDRVAVITLDRPEQLNAYTVQMGEDLVHAFDSLRTDDSVHVVVLTGAGRAFCAGLDLNALGATPDPALPALGEERLIRSFGAELFNYPKPVIAAINGAAAGIGVTMTLPCDIRIAAAGAKLAFPFAKLGIVPGLGSSFLLPRLLGPGQAKILALTGQTISAEEALAIGLVDRVVAPESLLDESLELARAIAANSPQIVGLIKEALNASATATSIDAALAFEHAQNARRSKILS
ncbi:MAG: enoyl-CoA hydratase/isomerase family protein [Gammaproteobacteria bacterium]|nr:enoyl-CoA hydratase/isomerase family protein [Gammaproteobacteria bacterium]